MMTAVGAAIVGWTGSRQYERSLRRFAKQERDMHLTSHGLYRVSDGVKLATPTESSVFDLLGVPFLKPSDRNC
jgi:DNA polymerase/3'-5' exonuclease PolX